MLTFASCQKDDLLPEALPDTVSVTGVSLDAATYTLLPGETFTLAATVAPDDATNKGVAWESSSTVVAVSDAGLVTAVSAGAATITVTTSDGAHTAACAVSVLYVIDFEEAGIEDYLAGPTIAGENLYSIYSGNRYVGYYNTATDLSMIINEEGEWSTSPNLFNGGIFISQFNDMTTPGDANQCSVYYSDPVTHKGGYKGSNTFAVHYGNNNDFMGDARSFIQFLDDDTEGIFDHFYVTNSTYAFLAMRDGLNQASPLTYDNLGWLRLIIDGLDKNGNVVNTLYFYLADFRTSASPGIITEWTKVDLSSLGKVHALRFDVEGSDTGAYGFNGPAYFCFDNLAIKK
jgi:hypothetical protein